LIFYIVCFTIIAIKALKTSSKTEIIKMIQKKVFAK